ncbi:MAG: M48 family metallopeptidase [Bacteroidetes bacterium]|nr:M48 family metallopeptidase [Bacteroidota bacterium]
MKQYFSFPLGRSGWALFLFVFILSCTKVPITGRRQMNLLAEGDLMKMSLTEYNKFLGTHPPTPETDANAQLVKKVGKNIQAAVEKFMNANKKYKKRIAGYNWQFNLVEEKTVNAWCMPGGKVVVYSGLLPVTQNETALAVVMGHEIAHAIARHGNERMSQQLALQVGAAAVSVAVSSQSAASQDIFNKSYGVASGLGALAYSRKHESEADKLGLVFMAMAGYDPHEAVAFWERMAKASKGGSMAILSTHPSDEKRIEDIKKFLPKAMKYYHPTTPQ